MYHFYYDLSNKYQETINNFLSFQVSKEQKHSKDLEMLKKILFDKSEIPNQKSLKKGLEILLSVDFRTKMKMIKIPFLRIYGALDALVPKKIANLVDIICPNSQSVIIEKAGHIPFISHKKEFCSILLEYFFKKI